MSNIVTPPFIKVGVSFLAGLGFAVLLVPVNKWLAIKIQKLSKDMMTQKDARVKVQLYYKFQNANTVWY